MRAHACVVPPCNACRAVLSPSDPANLIQSAAKPIAQLSGTTTMGPCVLGARLGADAGSGRLTSWSVGMNYTRMSADDDAKGVVERLNGQQVRRTCPPRTSYWRCQGHMPMHGVCLGGAS